MFWQLVFLIGFIFVLTYDPESGTLNHLVSDQNYYIDTVKNQYNFINGKWLENNLDQWMSAIKVWRTGNNMKQFPTFLDGR